MTEAAFYNITSFPTLVVPAQDEAEIINGYEEIATFFHLASSESEERVRSEIEIERARWGLKHALLIAILIYVPFLIVFLWLIIKMLIKG